MIGLFFFALENCKINLISFADLYVCSYIKLIRPIIVSICLKIQWRIYVKSYSTHI